MPKKVLYLVGSLNAGGLETYLLRFLQFHRKDEVFVLCKMGVAGDLREQYEKVTDYIFLLKVGYLNIGAFYKLYRFFKKEHFDTVCDFSGNFAGIPLWLAKKAGVQNRLVFYRGSENHFKPSRLNLLYNSLVQRLTYKYATRILSNSHAAFDFFYPHRNKDSRFEVIYNGIDTTNLLQASKEELRQEFNLPVTAFVIGHTGRYVYAKNHETILQVAFTLCKKFDDIYFVLVGKGVDEIYRKIIIEKGLESKILLLGYRKDVLRLLPLLDLFYFPSVTEGQPNSLIEAMITGLPVVASDIPSIRECVPSVLHSSLLPPTDVKKATEYLEFLYKNREVLEDLKVKKWALEHFSAEVWFEHFRKQL